MSDDEDVDNASISSEDSWGLPLDLFVKRKLRQASGNGSGNGSFSAAALSPPTIINDKLKRQRRARLPRKDPRPEVVASESTNESLSPTSASSAMTSATSPTTAAPRRQRPKSTSKKAVDSKAPSAEIVCLWNNCQMTIPNTAIAVRQHMTSYHAPNGQAWGPQKRQIGPCRWNGCTRSLTMECMFRHVQNYHLQVLGTACPYCDRAFTRKDALGRHLRDNHCSVCHIYVPAGRMKEHEESCNGSTISDEM